MTSTRFKIKFWETESDRDSGESVVSGEEFHKVDDAMALARTLFKVGSACAVEVLTVDKDELVFHLSFDENTTNPYIEDNSHQYRSASEVDFNDDTKIIYIPENWNEFDSESKDGITGKDILDLCEGNLPLAHYIYDLCEWQFPATVLDEFNRDDEETMEMVMETYGDAA